MKKNLTLILFLALLSLSGWQIADRISAQQKPLTLAQILTGLQTEGKTAETRTLAARNRYIAKRVEQVKVSFTLTAEREKDLREAGASDELIAMIRRNSPPLQMPTQSPVKSATNGSREIKNSIGMEFVRISAGSFMMGSPTSEKGRESDEKQHRVTISRDFYMGKYEVTQGQWKAVMGNNPSKFSSCGNDCPVSEVSWNDVQKFIRQLNAQDNGTYRLPTEAEWEYAARAGTTGDYAGNLDSMAWYKANSGGRLHEVGTKQANAWGLYDMHGNVWEWCADWYASDYYANSPNVDPTGPGSGTIRVARDGAYDDDAPVLRSANRRNGGTTEGYYFIGFRVVRE